MLLFLFDEERRLCRRSHSTDVGPAGSASPRPGAALPSGVAASIPLQLGPQLPAEVQLFISQLLEPRPELRLGAGSCGSHDVRSHAFFAGWNWSKMTWD